MMKYISKIILSIILFGIIIISPNVYAASASVTASAQTVYVGDPASFTVSINAMGWNVTVSGMTNDILSDINFGGNTSTSKSYPVNTSSPGTHTLSISGDITDADSDDGFGNPVATPVGGSATITVIERPAVQPVTPTPTPTPPTNNNTNNGGATTNGNTNSNNANTNDNNNSINANTETKTQETKTTEPAKKPIEVTKFEIVGYDLDFDSKTKSYTLNIGKEVSKLYLIVEGKDITSDGTGIIDIANKDKVTFRLKNSDQEVEYTINLNKQSLGNSVSVTAKDKGNIFMATTVIFGWSTVILAFFLAKDIIKIRKQNKESL